MKKILLSLLLFACFVGAAQNKVTLTGGSGTGASLPVQKFDILATGQSNMVNRDSTMGTWTYLTSPKIIVAQDNGTWQMANPASNNISPQDVNAVVNKERNNIAFAFARNYLKRYPLTDSIRMIVSADGGESSDKWTPKTTGEGELSTSNFMLDSIINKLNRTPSDYSAKVILVHQGENDDLGNITSVWLNHWSEIYDTLVAHSRVDDRAIMILGSFSTNTNYDSVRVALDSVLYGARIFGGRPIYAANFFAESTGTHMFDVTHFGNEIIDRAGAAYFATYQASFQDNQPGFKRTTSGVSAATTDQVYVGPLPPAFNSGDRFRYKAWGANADISFGENGSGTYLQLRSSSSVTALLRSYTSTYQMNLNAGGLQMQGNLSGQVSSSDRYLLEASSNPRLIIYNTSAATAAAIRGYLTSGVQASFLLGAVEIGVAGTTKGELWLHGNTSGTAKIMPPAAAGATTITLPGATGTLATLAGSESFTNKTFSTGNGVSAGFTYTAGVKQSFAPNGTSAGISVGSHTADPSSLSNGDLWYNSTSDKLKARIGGATVELGAGGGSGATPQLDNLSSVAINTSLISDANNTDDLGSSANAWKDAYLYTLKLKGSSSGTATITPLSAAGSTTIYLPASNGHIMNFFAANESGGVSAPNPWGGARSNLYVLDGLSTNATFGIPGGSPLDGNVIYMRIQDNGTARTLSWNAIYDEGSDLPLPTTTIAGEGMRLQFSYNNTTSKWELIGLTGGF